jgi:hypothetical protein
MTCGEASAGLGAVLEAHNVLDFVQKMQTIRDALQKITAKSSFCIKNADKIVYLTVT